MKLILFGNTFNPASIEKKMPDSNDPETEVLLEETDEEISQNQGISKEKQTRPVASNLETDEDASCGFED